jgi:ATPase subunit of ABC transporter with duplicated ATPase domains
VESEIQILRDLNVEEKLNRWTTVIEDDQRVHETRETIRQLLESNENFFNQWESRLSALSHSLGQGKSEHRHLLELLAEHIDSLRKGLDQARDGIVVQIGRQTKTIDELVGQWEAGRETIEKEMQAVKRELGQKGLDPDRLGALTRERAQVSALLAKMASLNEDLENLRAERERIKRELGEERLELFRLRQKRLESINTVLDGILRIDVKYEEEAEEFKKELRNLLKGSNVSTEAISSIVCTPQKTIDGQLLSKYIQAGEDRIRDELGLTQAMAARLSKWFSESERLYRLETLFPEDKIEIELNVAGKYRPIARLSVGQKATALLLLLFAQEKRILLLDQPEEDLDNRFIYEDVVKVLRTMKGKRQLVIATHNANIPVPGDAEYILALEPKKERCSIAAQGAIETMKAEVKGVMEGGEEAL